MRVRLNVQLESIANTMTGPFTVSTTEVAGSIREAAKKADKLETELINAKLEVQHLQQRNDRLMGKGI
jgi:hypothetical protein